MIKRTLKFFGVLTMVLLFSACDKPKNKSGGVASQPGDELIGYWQNTTVLSARERRSGVIMRLHFYRENGTSVVEWCAANGTAGLAKYKVQGKHLVVNEGLNKSASNGTDINLNAEITSFQPDQLILNGSNVYRRFTPSENSSRVCLR